MARPAPSRLRAQLAVLVATAAAATVMALWANAATGDDAGDTIRLGADGASAPGDPNPTNAGRPLPEVELEDRDGRTLTLRSDGRPMVVNLWFADCPPCARELAGFAAVHAEVGDRVRFVGVNPIDDVERMEAFAGERGVTYELLRGAALADELGVTSYPATLFVDADGTILAQTGVLDADELRLHVEAHW